MAESWVSQIRPVEDLRGPAGRLETVLNTGRDDAAYAALVCHPHPLGGGTMHTKAVYHAMKAFSTFGLPVLRFNFRGVGLSDGEHDHGRGEQDDVRAALDWLEHTFHHRPVLFAGFSFGSYVGLRVCCGDPKLFLSGDHDEFAPREELTAALASAPEPKQLVLIEGADHFFLGTPESPAPKLAQMQTAMRAWIGETFGLEETSAACS